MSGPLYLVELNRWGISNNSTNPVATTQGINNALVWASGQGYETVKLPEGTYLIDKNSQVNLVSDMHLILDEKAVVQKESNSYAEYKTLYISPLTQNVTISGGSLVGDRHSHNYSSGGTHEFGYGLIMEGGINVVVDRMTIHGFTGDGIFIGADDRYINTLAEADFQSGGVDDLGRLTTEVGKIRSVSAKLNFSHPIFNSRRVFQMARKRNVTTDFFSVYFYRADGSFISKVANARFVYTDVPIPMDAARFYIVVDQSTLTRVELGMYAQAKSKRVTVHGCDIFDNRRQGISVVGAEHVHIDGNNIHDIQGTGPQSGIDSEGGFFPNSQIRIINNMFYRNRAYDVILFDGIDLTVRDNWMGSEGAIGLASTKARYYQVAGNTFDRSSVYAEGRDGKLENNTVIMAQVNIYGRNISVDGLTVFDSTVTVKTPSPFDATIRNAKLVGTVLDLQNAADCSNIDIVKGNFRGNVTDGLPNYTNLNVLNYNAFQNINLPQGIYNGCSFQYGADTVEGWYGASVLRAGKFTFNDCFFRMKTTSLEISHADAEVTVNNCVFDIQAPIGYGKAALYVRKAKSIIALNNIITAVQLTSTNVAIIKINEYGGGSALSDVQEGILSGNVIHTNLSAKGISTVDAGIGAPSYVVTNNTLRGGVLELKSTDINSGNIVL